MYQCISSQKIGFFLVLAALLAALCLTVSRMGKALAAQEPPPDAVFLPVIMYHSLTEPTNDYQLSPAAFGQDLAYLQSHGYESVTVRQLADYTRGIGELPAHPVLITFDDGFYTNLSAALPLLEQYDMQAVVSVVGRYTEELAPADPHVERYSYLTWDDIWALLDSGRVELGSHTYDLHTNDKRAGCSILLGEDVDAISDDLSDVEDYLCDEDWDEEDDEDWDLEDEEEDEDEEPLFFEVTCPACEKTITVDEDVLNLGSIQCPNCGELMEFEFDEDDEAPEE